MRTPTEEHEVMGGIQRLYWFPNGYGASVVCHMGSYGNERGLWELAVLRGPSLKEAHLCYDTQITDDVEGFLSEQAVDELLTKVEGLPSETPQPA